MSSQSDFTSNSTVSLSRWEEILNKLKYSDVRLYKLATKRALNNFKTDLTDRRRNFPKSLIDFAGRHYYHYSEALESDNEVASEWRTALRDTIILANTIALSTHYTLMRADKKLCDTLEDIDNDDYYVISQLAASKGFDPIVIIGWSEVLAITSEINRIRDDEKSRNQKKAREDEMNEQMLSHWTIRGLEFVTPEEIEEGLPGWAMNLIAPPHWLDRDFCESP